MDFEKFSRNVYNRPNSSAYIYYNSNVSSTVLSAGRRSVLSVSFSSTFNVCIKKSNIEMNHQISNYDS